MVNVRFYAPISDGTFLDRIDELGRSGVQCVMQSPSYARCTWRGAQFNIVHDPEGGIRAQLANDGGMGVRAWDVVEPILSGGASQHVGQSMVEGEGDHLVGAFFYDPDLAKFGNAFSPFVQTDSFERANLALQRPFEDRYNPRYDIQPTWAEWQGWGSDEMVGALARTDSAGLVSRASSAVDKRALVATAVIAGITTLLALRNKHHTLEIIAAGVGGIALTWGLSAGASLSASR